MMRGAGFWACRRNSGYVIMGGWSLGGGVVGGSSRSGVDDVDAFWEVVGGMDWEGSCRSIPWSSVTIASCVSSKLSISALVRPLDSRKTFFRSIGASRMESSLRNSDAFSIREALGSDSCSCSVCSFAGVLSVSSGRLEDSCCCHGGLPLAFGPSESLMETSVV